MKNKLHIYGLLIVTNLILLQVAIGQKVQLKMGPEYKLKKRTQMPNKFIYGDNSSSYLLRNNVNLGSVYAAAYTFGLAKVTATASLEKYDGKMNEVFDKGINSPVKDLSVRDVMWCKDKFVLITSKFDKNAKTNTVYGNFMDNDGTVQPNAVTLMKLEVEAKHGTGSFYFRISDDSTKVLVYANPPYDKDGNQKFAFSVYNTSLEKQWEKVVTLPYKDKMIDIYNEIISNNGDVYLLVKKYDGEAPKQAKRNENGKEANYKFMVLAYTNQGNDYKEYTFDLSGKFVVDPTFKLDPKGNLAFAGFYTDKLGGSEKGIFYSTIDALTKEVKASSTKEFTTEMIEAFGKNRMERKKNGNDAGLRNFVFRKFLLKDDGGAVLLAENYYVVEITTTDKYGTRTTYQYHYNDILAIGVNSSGSIDWFTRIPKMQVCQGIPLLSFGFSPLVAGDKVYLLYNDNKKNLAGDTKGKAKGFTGAGIAQVAIIDSKGGVTKKELFDAKDMKTQLQVQLSRQVTPNSMVVYMQKGKNYRIGSITID